MPIILVFFYSFIATVYSAQPDPNVPNLIYVPLENKREDIDLLNSYWPLKEDSFVADLNSLQASRWAVVVFESIKGRSARDTDHDHDNTTNTVLPVTNISLTTFPPISTLRPIEGGGLLDNKDALDEIDFLRKYIEEDHKLTVNNQDYYYKNVCLSYLSPVTNRSVCRLPEVNIVDMLDPSQRQVLWKGYQKPSLYPYYGDRGTPLGVKMMTGPVLGGVDIDQNTGEVRSVRQLALKYFLRTYGSDGIDGVALDWRNSLRDYILNKHRPSTIIDFKYLDDEMMKMRLDAKTSNPNLAARLLDPTPSATSSGFWSNGLTAQLIFTRVPDLSRDPEVRAILKTLSAFENTPYTFGEEGTVCWIRSFLAWRKWLVAHLYGAQTDNEDQPSQTTISSPSPFGNFNEDLRIFLQNPYYPVYSQHVVMQDLTGDGIPDVKAFRCFITLRNLTDQDQRSRAMQFLREQAASNGRYNISVLGDDFFPPVSMSAMIIRMSFVTLAMALVALFMTFF